MFLALLIKGLRAIPCPPITRSRVTRIYLTITGACSMAIDDQFEGKHVPVHQAAIGGKVLERHAARRETLLEAPADFFSGRLRKPVETVPYASRLSLTL